MAHTKTVHALIVTDDGELVVDDTFDTDVLRAQALHDVLLENHDEIDEPAPDDVIAEGTDAVIDWYQNDLADIGIDVYSNIRQIEVPAPQSLFHVINRIPGSQISVDSFTSAADRQASLAHRAALLGFDMSADDDEDTIAELIENSSEAGLEITLVDADLDNDNAQWHGFTDDIEPIDRAQVH